MKSLKLIIIALAAVFAFSQVSYSAEVAEIPTDLTGIWEVNIKVAGGEESNDTALIVQTGDAFTYNSISSPSEALSGAIRKGKYNIYGPLPRTLVQSYWYQVDKIVLNAQDNDNFIGKTYISIYQTETTTSKMMSTDAKMIGTRVMDPPPFMKIVGKSEVWVQTGTQYDDPGAVAFDQTGADNSDKIVVNNTTDINKAGDYTITYNATGENGKAANEIARTVHVVNPAPPRIELKDNTATVKKGSTYLDASPYAFNFLQEDISDTITTTINGKEMTPNLIDTSRAKKTFEIVYSVTDDNGTVTATRTVTVEGLEDEQSFVSYCFISNLIP